MKLTKVISSGGGIILILGIIFHFQGLAILGPQTSFMYSSPEWTAYGIQIAIVGFLIIITGISITIIRKKSKTQQI